MIHVELLRLARRPRTWMNLILLCALPIIVAVFISATNLVPAPGQGPAFLSAVLDGSLYPAAGLAIVLPVFLPRYQWPCSPVTAWPESPVPACCATCSPGPSRAPAC